MLGLNARDVCDSSIFVKFHFQKFFLDCELRYTYVHLHGLKLVTVCACSSAYRTEGDLSMNKTRLVLRAT